MDIDARPRPAGFAAQDPILTGGGECGALLRALDWNDNPLGPPDGWPGELRTLVGVMLASAQPILIVWGPRQITLYNDGYAAMCGDRHPDALGKPFRDLWFDIWDEVEPILTRAYDGVSTRMDDIEFTMHRNGYPEEAHFAFSYTPVRDAANVVLGMFCACVETTAQVMAARRDQEDSERLRRLLEYAPGAIAVVVGPDHRFLLANKALRDMIGVEDSVGKRARDVLPDIVTQRVVDLLDSVYRTGERHVGRNVEVDIRGPRGDADRPRRWLDLVYEPVRNARGEIAGVFAQIQDVTERALAEEQQRLVNVEIAHRMKNQLAVVSAIVSQSLRGAKTIERARELISSRIGALARAQQSLIDNPFGLAQLEHVVRAAIGAHENADAPRFDIAGPGMSIAARPALSLSLILHELATNATKYGALSTPGGRVEIAWSRTPAADGGEARFALTWRESGGPPVRAPKSSGGGARLIRAGLGGARHSRVTLDYAPDGVRATIEADLDSISSDPIARL